MKRLVSSVSLLFVLVFAPVACRREVAALDKADAATDLMRLDPPAPACAPTETRVCTLGPPPVCRCVPPKVIDKK